MESGIFITGTDTSVGKTVVSCAIASALHRRDISVAVYKPVETGCRNVDGALVGEDCKRLLEASRSSQAPTTVSSYLFEMPAAPIVAARAANIEIDPEKLIDDFEELTEHHDFVLVEGAGGLLVPIAEEFTFAELADECDVPVVCVAASRMGCINHTLLTLRALDDEGIDVCGYILNRASADGDDPTVDTNREAIAAFADDTDLGEFPYVEPDSLDNYDWLGELAEQHLKIDAFAPEDEAA